MDKTPWEIVRNANLRDDPPGWRNGVKGWIYHVFGNITDFEKIVALTMALRAEREKNDGRKE